MNGLGAVITAFLLCAPAMAQSPALVAELPNAPVANSLNLSAQNVQAGAAAVRNDEGPADAGASRTDGP